MTDIVDGIAKRKGSDFSEDKRKKAKASISSSKRLKRIGPGVFDLA